MSTPRFLVSPEALSGSSVVLTGPELRHARARRLRVGSELVLTDGRGRDQRGVVTALDRQHAAIRLVPESPHYESSALRLVLAQALLKSDKLDWVVEKATELGVSELLLFKSERSLGTATSERQARWNRVARSAAKQCQRSTLPVIRGALAFDELLIYPDAQVRLLFSETARSDWRTVQREIPSIDSVLALVGPEGGFSPAEAERAARASYRLVGLGRRILRAETAAVVALTLCQFLWGDLAGTND